MRSHTQGMSTNSLAVGLGKPDDGLAARETEDVARPLGRVPLHAVRRGDLAEIARVGQDADVRGVTELAVVRRGTEVRLALRSDERVEAGVDGRRARRRARRWVRRVRRRWWWWWRRWGGRRGRVPGEALRVVCGPRSVSFRLDALGGSTHRDWRRCRRSPRRRLSRRSSLCRPGGVSVIVRGERVRPNQLNGRGREGGRRERLERTHALAPQGVLGIGSSGQKGSCEEELDSSRTDHAE